MIFLWILFALGVVLGFLDCFYVWQEAARSGGNLHLSSIWFLIYNQHGLPKALLAKLLTTTIVLLFMVIFKQLAALIVLDCLLAVLADASYLDYKA